MIKIEQMNKWNYQEAWNFFSKNSFNRLIPEAELYVRSLTHCSTEDLRNDKDARKKILEVLKKNSLILIDGSSLNGKTTFAKRLAKHIKADVVDIDLICKDWIEQQVEKTSNPIKKLSFLMDMDRLTDVYILDNLEKIIQKKSQNGNVILVGCYIEVVYRAIIAKTLGKYFDQVVSIYCCAKSFNKIMMMKKKRDDEFGFSPENEDQKILFEYNYSKRLLQDNGIMLGFGMASSFIADTGISDMFA